MSAPALLESSYSYQENNPRLSEEIQNAVGRLACGELITVFNESVLAIVGNAYDPLLAEKLQLLKRDPSRSTVGLTVPFRDMLPMVDDEKVIDPKYRKLLRDEEDQLTKRYAGIGFVRVPAQKELLDNPRVPQILLGIDSRTGGPTIQGYSPTGSDMASLLIRTAQAYQPKPGTDERFILPVMTSGNITGQPEITTLEGAATFINDAPESVHPTMLNVGRLPAPDTKPLGSYPILTLRSDNNGNSYLERTREGCISGEILQQLFEGYEIDMYPEDFKSSSYPDNIFGVDDLPEAFRHLTGPELRLGILATTGWQEDARILLDETLYLQHPWMPPTFQD